PDPAGLLAVHRQIDEVITRSVQHDVKPGVFYDSVTDLTLYAESIDPRTGEWRHVLVHDARDHQAPLLLLAQTGGVARSEGDPDLRLRLDRGEAHRQEVGGADYSKVLFRSASLEVGVEDSLLRKNTFRTPEGEWTLAELWRESERQRREHGWWRLTRSIFHRRLGLPLAASAFIWLGVPLALGTPARGSRARGYLLGIAAVAAYYVLQRLGISLGSEARLPPWLGGELANVTAAAGGLVAWLWILRRR
ncbi:MAG: LptF/LptG family permease, partial [Myxococcales bacterium]